MNVVKEGWRTGLVEVCWANEVRFCSHHWFESCWVDCVQAIVVLAIVSPSHPSVVGLV